MRKLGQYITSDYISAANALRGKSKGRVVMVYVESYDDVVFWRAILSLLETAEVKFNIALPTRNDKLERGKKAALMAALKDRVGRDMIACVDADYDFLRQGTTTLSAALINNPYVFHTYAYSIENLLCWAPSLHDVCVMVTLNDSPYPVDFEAFMRSYSIVIYPLFVWSVLCARDAQHGKFTISDFMLTIKMGSLTKGNLPRALERVEQKVNSCLRRVTSAATPHTLDAYEALCRELTALGIVPEETYMYIQGHQLMNDTIVPLLTAVCNDLIRQRESEIQHQSKHNTQRRNEMSCYEHSIESVSSMLKKHTHYLRSPQARRILADLKTFLNDR